MKYGNIVEAETPLEVIVKADMRSLKHAFKILTLSLFAQSSEWPTDHHFSIDGVKS